MERLPNMSHETGDDHQECTNDLEQWKTGVAQKEEIEKEVIDSLSRYSYKQGKKSGGS